VETVKELSDKPFLFRLTEQLGRGEVLTAPIMVYDLNLEGRAGLGNYEWTKNVRKRKENN